MGRRARFELVLVVVLLVVTVACGTAEDDDPRLSVGGSVPAGELPFAVAVSADGGVLFVAGEDEIAMLDAITGKPRSSVPVTGFTEALALSPDGSLLYAALYYPGLSVGGELLVIDVATATISARAPVPGGTRGLALTADGSAIHLTAAETNSFHVLDAATGVLERTVAVGDTPIALALAPGDERAYVANRLDGTVSVVDPAAGVVVATVPIGEYADAIGVGPDGERIYVANGGNSTLSVIDARTDGVVATVPVGDDPVGAVVAGERLYSINRGDGTISEIETEGLTVLATLPVATSVEYPVLGQDGRLRVVAGVDSARSDGGTEPDREYTVVTLETGAAPAPPRPAALPTTWAATAGVIGPVRTRYAAQIAGVERELVACPPGGTAADPGCAATLGHVVELVSILVDETEGRVPTDDLEITVGPTLPALEYYNDLSCRTGFTAGGSMERDAGCTVADEALREVWRTFTVVTAQL